MSNENKVRLAHELLDEINARQDLTQEQTEVLRSFLPALPVQKTLEELRHAVYAAWSGTHGNKWLDDVDGDLETWLYELHQQLKGLKNAPAAAVPALPEGLRLAIHDQYGRCVVSPESDANGVCEILYTDSDSELGSNYDYAHQCELTFIDAVPALSAGMRLADHEQYGRVVTSPKPDQDGVYVLLMPKPKVETGADWGYAHECELTFIDAEPAKPAHPEVLITGADYQDAPGGTVVAIENADTAWIKKGDSWSNTDGERRTDSQILWGVPREVLRWGSEGK